MHSSTAGSFSRDTRPIVQCQFEASLLRLRESKQEFMGRIRSGAIPWAVQNSCVQETQPSSSWHSNPQKQLSPRRNGNICSALSRHFSGAQPSRCDTALSQAGVTKRKENQSPVNPFLSWEQTALWTQTQWNRVLGVEYHHQENRIILWRKGMRPFHFALD